MQVASDIELKIENLIAGFRTWGYQVLSEPVPGEEAAYCQELRAGLGRMDAMVDYLHASARCRGASKRTMRLLHSHLSEPCWGVKTASP